MFPVRHNTSRELKRACSSVSFAGLGPCTCTYMLPAKVAFSCSTMRLCCVQVTYEGLSMSMALCGRNCLSHEPHLLLVLAIGLAILCPPRPLPGTAKPETLLCLPYGECRLLG